MKTIAVDTNIILRFLRDDNPSLHSQAKKFISDAENGDYKIYIDEVIVAEAVWVLIKYYQQSAREVSLSLARLISQRWMINPRKKLVVQSLHLFGEENLSYIDCWLLCLSRARKFTLETLDRKLQKRAS